MLFEEVADGIGGLCAVCEPLLGEVCVDADYLGIADGIIDADLLDVLSVACLSGIGGNDAVKGAFFAPILVSLSLTICFSFCRFAAYI